VRQLRAAVCVLAQWLVARAAGDGLPPRDVCIEHHHLERHLCERADAFGVPRAAPEHRAPSSLDVDAPLQKADARRLSAAQLAAILDACDGNRSEAARQLGIARNTLARKIREFGLEV
jgi:transcriptional regulator of acetoin/glycerol metabolism